MSNPSGRKSAHSGIIFNIQQFSLFDGPGIRTAVFMKGCNLRCAWCHNPESIGHAPQLSFNPAVCIGCGKCFGACPQKAHRMAQGEHIIDRSLCNLCFRCAEVCFAEALTAVGKEMTVDEVMSVVLKDKPYYDSSGGGATFSGGEPMAQPGFLESLLRACKEAGVPTAVDTAGNVPYSSFESINDYTDLYLYDIKAADDALHRRLTGVSNRLIIENFALLIRDGKNVVVRVPYIPGGNAGDMANIAEVLGGFPRGRHLGVAAVEIMGYHRLGETKRKLIGLPPEGTEGSAAPFTAPDRDELGRAADLFRGKGIECVVSGFC